MPGESDDRKAKQERQVAREMREREMMDMLASSIIIQVRESNAQNGAASHMRRTIANKTWLVPGEYNTQTNCFYVAWCMLQNPSKFLTEYAEWLEGKRTGYPNFNDAAKSKKKEVRRALKLSEERISTIWNCPSYTRSALFGRLEIRRANTAA